MLAAINPLDSVEFDHVLYGMVAPFVIALVLAGAFGWRAWRRDFDGNGHWAGPISLAAGLMLAVLGVRPGVPPWTPRNADDWLFYIAAAVAVLGLVYAFVRLPIYVNALLSFIAGAGATWLIAMGLVPHAMSQADALWHALGIGIVVSAITVGLDPIAHRERGLLMPLIMGLCIGAAAGVIGMSGSQKLAMYAGGVGTAIAGLAIVSLRARQFAMSRGGVLVFAVLLAGTLLAGHLLAELTRPNAILVLLAPLALLLIRLPILRSRKPKTRAAIAVIITLIPLGIALARAAIVFNAANQSSPMGGEEYYF